MAIGGATSRAGTSGRAGSGRALAAGGGGVNGHDDLRGTEHAILEEIASERLGDDGLVVHVEALHAAHRLVARRVERLADGDERPDPEALQRGQKVPVD